ncbi:hypothetical protein NLX83_34530 [Allokutzneria sp. A3M-2-11 16]|uniref:hypothetical protein n=1 Tax=Allokutzneria sp. A3M-2-11 16 TaxID=2962043 RepID=UPI0020B78285|nr:hypothetical protein [Allokutzneria sp. A3M-2-11 16]MCP3804397.1 hypothetical protein [Allokutzneria sp. A3M-2-11 16]
MSLVDVRSWTPAALSVAEAAHRFLVDVAATRGALSVTAVVADHGDAGVEITLGFGTGTEIGGSVSTHVGDDEDVCAAVADRLQEMMIDYLFGAWPECPGHGHPAASRRLAGAVWVCPTEGEKHFAVPVGRYPHKVNVPL